MFKGELDSVSKMSSSEHEERPTKELQEVIDRSQIFSVVCNFNELNFSTITKEIHENGNRFYIEATWPLDNVHLNRIVIGIRKDSIKFIGEHNPDPEKDQFIELKGKDMFKKRVLLKSLSKTFMHPSTINSSSRCR